MPRTPTASASELARAEPQTSRRYAFEIETGSVAIEARSRPVSRDVIDSIIERGVVLSDPARETDGWIVRA